MVLSYNINPSAFRSGQLSVDTTGHLPPKGFEEDDGILDESILDRNAIDSGLEMSPPMSDSRRESFAIGSAFFSPKQDDWTTIEMQSLPMVNPFADPSSTNPFLRMDQQQQQQQQQQQSQQAHHQHHHAMQAQLSSWPMTASTSAASGVATPVAHFGGLVPDFDGSASVYQRGMQTPFAPMGGLFQTVQAMPVVSSAAAMGATATAVSVPMQLSSSNDSVDTQSAMVKRLPPQSPMVRSHNEMRRGDGIRKKNSRFDIPSDRNLTNIDSLISKSTDEQEIKELKQQKRLLRNRQAALDSRQRKKQHTERLEDEKKHYTSVMSDMEQTINELRIQVAELQLEKQNYVQYIESLNMEKEEMIRQHTIETVDLRKKVSVLSNHLQDFESAAASSHVPGYTGAGAGVSTMGSFGEVGGLGMDAAPDSWEDLFNGMSGVEQQQQPEQQLQHVTVVKPEPESRKVDATVSSVMAPTEKSGTQGGLLFMLFLVGAFVMSSRQMPTIPPVSDDIRVASAELLDNVLKDVNMQDNTLSVSASTVPSAVVASASVHANVAAPSGSSWAQPTTVEPSMLGQLSDQLMQPTEEQANEQLFSLNAAQYSGVVNYQHPPTVDSAASPAPTSQGRRNLADALAAMRSNSKAEVYTRSLLWDQIPSDVVRSFVKMVSEVNMATPSSDGEQ